jgi:inorganic pyrophosphatase
MKVTEHYFAKYKDLKKPGTCTPLGFFDTAEAVKIIKECEERYDTDYAPKLEA